jgi:hypothetical protein
VYIIPCIHPEKIHAFFYYVNGILFIHEAFVILACLIRQEIYFVAVKKRVYSFLKTNTMERRRKIVQTLSPSGIRAWRCLSRSLIRSLRTCEVEPKKQVHEWKITFRVIDCSINLTLIDGLWALTKQKQNNSNESSKCVTKTPSISPWRNPS